jgi:Flp pilus assembly protein TadD
MKDESSKKSRIFLVAGLAMLVGLGGVGVWLARRLAAPAHPSSFILHPSVDNDPRRAYAGPYRNIHPDVRYVGDRACAECHEDIARSYARHPMGRSLRPAADLVFRQRFGPGTNNPFTALGRRFEVERRGKRSWHRQALLHSGEPVVELVLEVRWVIGSGTKGYSYLAERDGYLLQTPISYFTQKQRWDLSPGFGPETLAGRVVPASCLFCHANGVLAHPEHPDRFVPPVFAGQAIGCERCHGPGELHAAGDFDRTIVNPGRLSPLLRDAVCEQCHLEGEARILRSGRHLFDYRPGLPLSDFWAVLVRQRQGGEDAKAVNHVEQMHQSKCFRRSAGKKKLGCVSCHDPHVHVGKQERVAHYRAACLKCHAQGHCAEPLASRRKKSPNDNCIDCHMPRYSASDIAHTASTDHSIPRRALARPVGPADLDGASFADFYQDRFPANRDPQAERTLGMGLVKLMNAGRLRPDLHAERAVRLLESALAHHPGDVELRASKAQALLYLRPAEALGEVRLALAKRPGDWHLLTQAAVAAGADGQAEQALDHWRRAVQINPNVAASQVSLVGLLLRTGRLDEARRRTEGLLRLDPFNVSGRQARVGFLLRQGKRAEARREFAVIRRLAPPDLAEREEWFRKQLLGPGG